MRRWLVRVGSVVACAGMVACGSVSSKGDAGSNPADAASATDAPPGAIDAGTDASTTAAGPPSTEIVSGGTHVSGSTYSVDLQIGHAFMQGPVTGGGKTVEGAAAIKP